MLFCAGGYWILPWVTVRRERTAEGARLQVMRDTLKAQASPFMKVLIRVELL